MIAWLSSNFVMDKTKIKTAIIGGLAATAAMTMLIFLAPLMGMPDMKIGNMIADFIMIPLWLGWLMHLMFGIVWALFYVLYVRDELTISYILKGTIYALIPWLLMQILLAPIMGLGFFFSKSSEFLMLVLGTMMGHVLYGIVLVLSTKPKENL